jgi:hypothetical protein
MVQPYKESTDINIRLWGAVWLSGRSDLVIIKRDDESKRVVIQPFHISKFSKRRCLNAFNPAGPLCRIMQVFIFGQR